MASQWIAIYKNIRPQPLSILYTYSLVFILPSLARKKLTQWILAMTPISKSKPFQSALFNNHGSSYLGFILVVCSSAAGSIRDRLLGADSSLNAIQKSLQATIGVFALLNRYCPQLEQLLGLLMKCSKSIFGLYFKTTNEWTHRSIFIWLSGTPILPIFINNCWVIFDPQSFQFIAGRLKSGTHVVSSDMETYPPWI